MAEKRQVFVSYSRRDSDWLDRVRIFLRPLERDAQLQVWSDTDIQPSSNWQAEIQTAISDADAAILLISADFLASDYVASDELPQILAAASERGLRVFPIIVSTCFLRNSPLLKFQAVNSPSTPLDAVEVPEQNRILTRLAENIDDLLQVASAGITDEWLTKFRSRFVSVDGGTVPLGSSQANALAEYTTSIEDFSLGKHVVTQSEWTAVMNTQPWVNKENVKYGSEIPAVFVNWGDAADFINRLNRADSVFQYRLPTESEWECAARGGGAAARRSRRKFCFGDDPNQLAQYGWYDQNASLRGNNYAHSVGQLSPNDLGLFDMHGNIWEWTADEVKGLRPVRGGGFNFAAEGASSAFRLQQKPEMRSETIGFRLVRERRPARPSPPTRKRDAKPASQPASVTDDPSSSRQLSGRWSGTYSGFQPGDGYRLEMQLQLNRAEAHRFTGVLEFSGRRNAVVEVVGGRGSAPEAFSASSGWRKHLSSGESVDVRQEYYFVDHPRSGDRLEQGGVYRFTHGSDDSIRGLWFQAYESTPIGQFRLERSDA